MIHNRGIIEMTDLIGKRVRINDDCPYEVCRGLIGKVEEKVDWAEEGWSVTVTLEGKKVNFFLRVRWLDIIDGEDSMVGKRVRINENYPDDVFHGSEGVISGCGDDEYYRLEMYSGATFSLIEKWFAVIDEEKSNVENSLIELQKLCTANDINLLISKEDYQIWDTESDDSYVMRDVDDVMKAIECLNELKKWRQ